MAERRSNEMQRTARGRGERRGTEAEVRERN